MKKKNTKLKTIGNKQKKIVGWKIVYFLLVLGIVYHVLFLINTRFTKNDYFTIMGISFISMQSNTMKPDLQKNDFLIVKNSKEIELKDNDIIAYYVDGNMRVNKIINTSIKQGEKVFITKANINYYPDIEEIAREQIIGKVIFSVPILGFLLNILQAKITTIFIILFLILKFSYNNYSYRRKRERKKRLSQ